MINNKSLIQKTIKKYLVKYKKYENPDDYCVFSISNSNIDNSNNDKNFINAIKNLSKSNEILIPDIYKLKRCSSAKIQNNIRDSYVKSPLSCNKELLKIINKINKKNYDNNVNLILKAQKNLKFKKIYENHKNDKKDNYNSLPYLLKNDIKNHLKNLFYSKSEKKLTPYLKIKKVKDYQKLQIEQKINRNKNDKLFNKFCLFNSHSQQFINSSLNSNNFLSKNSQKNDSKLKGSSNKNLISLKKEKHNKSFLLYNNKNEKLNDNFNNDNKKNNYYNNNKEENKNNQINISNNSKYNLNFTNESYHKIKKIGIKNNILLKKQSKLINTNIEVINSNNNNNNKTNISNNNANDKNNKNELNNIILNNNNTPLMNNLLTKIIKLKSGENIQENLYNIY